MSKWHYRITSKKRIDLSTSDDDKINVTIEDVTEMIENRILRVEKYKK